MGPGEDVDDRVLGLLTVHDSVPGQVPACAGMTEVRGTRWSAASWVITGKAVATGGQPIRQDPLPRRRPDLSMARLQRTLSSQLRKS